MRGYNPADWVPFFTAVIAAAASLTGLLFVAVSINLDKIIKAESLSRPAPRRPWPRWYSS